MKDLYIIHAGIGKVGKEVIRQLCGIGKNIERNYQLKLSYCGLFNSSSGVYASEAIPLSQLCGDLEKNFFRIDDVKYIMEKMVDKTKLPFVFIDTTSSDDTYPLLEKTLQRKGFVVVSNKRPLAGPFTQFRKLHEYGNKLFYETTVGAGLPVISTLKTILATGDEIVGISGCFSGTLGFLCSSLEMGNSFSDSVMRAKKLGFTEFDPREDLSGKDVVRKALILARMIGVKIEQDEIKVQKLYPDEFDQLTVEKFMQKIKELDKNYKKRFEEAKRQKKTFRFVAKVSPVGCNVRLMEVSRDSDLGGLKGPDNIIIFKTKRYFERPMVIKGPGAGPEVTAAGVVGDILSVAGGIR